MTNTDPSNRHTVLRTAAAGDQTPGQAADRAVARTRRNLIADLAQLADSLAAPDAATNDGWDRGQLAALRTAALRVGAGADAALGADAGAAR